MLHLGLVLDASCRTMFYSVCKLRMPDNSSIFFIILFLKSAHVSKLVFLILFLFLVWCDLVFFSNTCTHSHFRHTHTQHRAQHFIVNVGAPEGRDQSKHTCISHKNGTKPFSGRSEVVEVGLEVSLPVVDVEGKLRRNYTRWFSKCFYKEYPICCHLQVNLTLRHLSIITLRRRLNQLWRNNIAPAQLCFGQSIDPLNMNVVFLFSVCEKSLPFFFLVMISFWSHLNQQSTFHLQLPLGHF